MFKDRLRILREGKGLTKKAMSQELNMPYTTYCHYEKGDNEPGNVLIAALARYFNVTSDYLLCIDDINDDVPKLDHKRNALNSELEKLSDSQIDEVLSFVKYLQWRDEQV